MDADKTASKVWASLFLLLLSLVYTFTQAKPNCSEYLRLLARHPVLRFLSGREPFLPLLSCGGTGTSQMHQTPIMLGTLWRIVFHLPHHFQVISKHWIKHSKIAGNSTQKTARKPGSFGTAVNPVGDTGFLFSSMPELEMRIRWNFLTGRQCNICNQLLILVRTQLRSSGNFGKCGCLLRLQGDYGMVVRKLADNFNNWANRPKQNILRPKLHNFCMTPPSRCNHHSWPSNSPQHSTSKGS